jgi:hypothetical protein
MPASLSRLWNEQSADTSGGEDFLITIAEITLNDKVFLALDPSQPLQEQQPLASAWDPQK